MLRYSTVIIALILTAGCADNALPPAATAGSAAVPTVDGAPIDTIAFGSCAFQWDEQPIWQTVAAARTGARSRSSWLPIPGHRSSPWPEWPRAGSWPGPCWRCAACCRRGASRTTALHLPLDRCWGPRAGYRPRGSRAGTLAGHPRSFRPGSPRLSVGKCEFPGQAAAHKLGQDLHDGQDAVAEERI